MKQIHILIYILFFFTSVAGAQPAFIKEIPQGSANFTKINNLVFFTSGDSLMRTDGTAAGTIFLKNGFDGFSSFKEHNGLLYFLTDSNRVNYSHFYKELWRSDGTPAGTFMLKTSSEFNMKIVDGAGNYLYFLASDAATGRELYRTNGAIAGTILVKDINPGNANGFDGTAGAVGNQLFFAANNGTHGRELWKTDGTTSGTVMIKDINPGSGDGFTGYSYYQAPVFSFNNKFYFTGKTVAHGEEPWVSDGTSAGTVLLVDSEPGSESSTRVEFKIIHGSSLYFITYHFGDESEYGDLWKTSGTVVSTVKLKSIVSDMNYGEYNYHHFRIYRGKVYFFAYENYFYDYLWVTDGTSDGTKEIYSMNTMEGSINFFEATNDYMFFYGLPQGSPTPLFRSDGTTSGTKPIVSFTSGYILKWPTDMEKVGDWILYTDHDGPSSFGEPENPEDYNQLMQTDGTSVRSVRSIFGQSLVGSNNILDFNSKALFTTYHDSKMKLWIYDPEKPAANVPYFTVVDADTDADIQWLKQGDTLYKKPDQNINVRYNYVSKPGSVVFKLEDAVYRIESAAPFTLAGDVNADYAPWKEANEGAYKLTATPYTSSGGNGTPGSALTVNFFIENLSGDTPPPPPSSLVFTLINADNEQDIRTLEDNDTIIYDSLVDHITIRANPFTPAGSVVFTLDGSVYRVESVAPFALHGDANDDYNPWPATYGNHVLTATVYSGSGGSGSMLEERTIHFLVKEEGDVQPPASLVFTLINADNEQDIRPLQDNDTVIYDALVDKITVRANPSQSVGSVVFKLDGSVYRVESAAPFALHGDAGGNYNPWPATYGNHTLVATAYSNSGGSGSIVEERTIHFLVKEKGGDTPPPGPIADIHFTLVNVNTNQDIGPLEDGQIIDISTIGTNQWNVRANSTLVGTKSVVFDFNGKSKYKTENSAPYSLFGDNSGVYNAFTFNPGTYTLAGIPHTGTNGSGTAGEGLAITFHVINGSGAMTAELRTYPNPVVNKMNVSLINEVSENAEVHIYDQSQKEYYHGMHQTDSGEFEVDLSGSDMKRGLYFVKIKTGEEVRVVKIVKD